MARCERVRVKSGILAGEFLLLTCASKAGNYYFKATMYLMHSVLRFRSNAKKCIPCILLLLMASIAYAEDGVTDSVIQLGSSMVITGPLGPSVLASLEGANLYFDKVNATGGIFGRKIYLKVLDDGLDPKRAYENSKKLFTEDKVFMLFNNVGTGATAAVLPLLTEHKRILFGPNTGATQFRENHHRYLFNVRPSYADEANLIVQQIRQLGISKVAIFIQDDIFGNTLLTEYKKAASVNKFEFIGVVKIDPKKADFKSAALEMQKLAPQVVIVGAAGQYFSDFVTAVLATDVRPSFYSAISSVNSAIIAKSIGPNSRGIVFGQVFPNLRNPSLPIVAEYIDALQQSKTPGVKPSTAHFEGFIHAKLLVEYLKRNGRNLTTDSLIKTMETSGEVSFGKFRLKYSPESHLGSSYVELAIMDAGGVLRY